MNKKYLRTAAALAVFLWTTQIILPHRVCSMEDNEVKPYRFVVKSTSKEHVTRVSLSGDVVKRAVYRAQNREVVAVKELEGLDVSFQPISRFNKLKNHQSLDTTLKLSYQGGVFEFALAPDVPGKMIFYYDVVDSGLVWNTLQRNAFHNGTLESLKEIDTEKEETHMLMEFPHGIQKLVGIAVKGYHTVVEIFDGWDETNI